MHLVASVCLLGVWLCGVQQMANKSHYQSKMLVCVSAISGPWTCADNRAHAVDPLLLTVKQ